MHNNVHDNNNPNVPQAGEASNGPTGTGMTISGGSHDTVMDNTFSNNGAWGILFVPFPDSGTPSLNQSCTGTGGEELAGLGCVYDPAGDALLHNHFSHNGFFGNPSNSDYGQITAADRASPELLRRQHRPRRQHARPTWSRPSPRAARSTTATTGGGDLEAQVLCDTGFGSCPAGANYPPLTKVVMHPLPSGLPTHAQPVRRASRPTPGAPTASRPDRQRPTGNPPEAGSFRPSRRRRPRTGRW